MIINNKYYYDNPETGLEEIDKELYDKLKELKKIHTNSKIGKVMVFGTGGDIKGHQDLEKMFHEPLNYGFIPFNNKWKGESLGDSFSIGE